MSRFHANHTPLAAICCIFFFHAVCLTICDDVSSANASANRLALTYRICPQHSNAHTSMPLAAKGRTHLPVVVNCHRAFVAMSWQNSVFSMWGFSKYDMKDTHLHPCKCVCSMCVLYVCAGIKAWFLGSSTGDWVVSQWALSPEAGDP